MEKLTQKQERVLKFIRERIREAVAPTIREIAAELGFSSTGTVRDYLAVLEKKGYLKRADKKSRSMELATGSAFKIPIIASIAAGKPNLAYEDIEGYLDADDLFLGRLSQNDVFALRVKGESMSGAGILEGDIAIIKKQPEAHNGDIIAALIDGQEATLKRFRIKDKRIFLEPAHQNYQPIYKHFSVIGKVITVLRKYA